CATHSSVPTAACWEEYGSPPATRQEPVKGVRASPDDSIGRSGKDAGRASYAGNMAPTEDAVRAGEGAVRWCADIFDRRLNRPGVQLEGAGTPRRQRRVEHAQGVERLDALEQEVLGAAV